MKSEELLAGQELDALMAEKVLKWDLSTCVQGYGVPPEGDPRRGVVYEFTCQPIPNFSASIPHAFEIVEHLKASWNQKGDDEPYVWTFSDCGEYGWRADIVWLHHDGNLDITGAQGETLPLAICRAALEYHLAFAK